MTLPCRQTAYSTRSFFTPVDPKPPAPLFITHYPNQPIPLRLIEGIHLHDGGHANTLQDELSNTIALLHYR